MVHFNISDAYFQLNICILSLKKAYLLNALTELLSSSCLKQASANRMKSKA